MVSSKGIQHLIIVSVFVVFSILLHYTFSNQYHFHHSEYAPETFTKFPKIYVHSFPSSLELPEITSGRVEIPMLGPYLTGAHKEDDPTYLYETLQHVNGLVLYHRLMASKHRTMNPKEADYIFVPLFTGILKKNVGNPLIYKVFSDSDLSNLEIPGITTGSIPFIVVGCSRGILPFATPFFSKHVLFIDQGSMLPDTSHRRFPWQQVHMQIPYPSFIHLPSTTFPLDQMPWKANMTSRKYFSVFIGAAGLTKHHKAYTKYFKARSRLRELMDKEDNMMFIAKDELETNPTYQEYIETYSSSLFCPHLGGDSCHRKAFHDFITVGCIPVIFDDFDCIWPFEDFIDYSEITVTLSAKEALDQGKFAQLLSEIPQKRIFQLLTNLEHSARHLQISLFDDDEDMFGIMLRKAAKMRHLFD